MDRRSFLLSATALPALARAAEDGFTPLFDGRSLSGWTVMDGPESAFYVRDGAIVIHEGANFPTWLRSAKQYENFDLRLEFFIQGWMDGGVYLHAPEHGRNAACGMDIKVFHKQDSKPLAESMGAIFPVVPPLKVNVRNRGEWNSMRVLMDWPVLRVWVNDEVVQDLDVESVPELRDRLRKGYIGIESLSYPIRFRNLRIRELPAKDRQDVLYGSPADLEKWFVADGKPKIEALGEVLRCDQIGYLATREQYRDFELQLYIRQSLWSNGGIIFRSDRNPAARHYEIQIHDVENAVYPTGSLYGFKRSVYPKVEPEKWYLFQMKVKGRNCLVRINGENVMEYHQLENLDAGHVMLQAHQADRWIEYKHIQIKTI